MMKYEKTDQTGLYRDIHSGAIVNRDLTALEAYKKKKAKQVQIKERQDRIEQELNEIKDILNQVISKLGAQ